MQRVLFAKIHRHAKSIRVSLDRSRAGRTNSGIPNPIQINLPRVQPMILKSTASNHINPKITAFTTRVYDNPRWRMDGSLGGGGGWCCKPTLLEACLGLGFGCEGAPSPRTPPLYCNQVLKQYAFVKCVLFVGESAQKKQVHATHIWSKSAGEV